MVSVVKPKSFIKPVVFIVSLLPLSWLIWQAVTDNLGANPVEKILHRTGDWALNFLLITLAVTPLRRIFGWAWLAKLRRMLGLFVFFYAALHFTTYIGIDKLFSWEEIVEDAAKHKRIIVGFASFLSLIPLAVTSSDRMIRRAGMKRWQRLHRLTYLAALGGVVHYLWLVKKDMQRPLIYAGIFAVLTGYRLVVWLVDSSCGVKSDQLQTGAEDR